MKRTNVLSWIYLLLAAGLLAGCSRADDPTPQKNEIQMDAAVWQMMQGAPSRRTYTFDDVSSLQTEAQFTCVAYEADSDPLETYIPTTTVDWDAGETRWEFNHGNSHYYWPLPTTNGGAHPSLDFFGYVPSAAHLSTEAPYISDIEYTETHNVTFTCSDLPMTNAEQDDDLKEFMFGMALGQNYGNAAAGVPLEFQHPFARVKLQLAASHPDIDINSITFRGIKNNGDYDLSASPKWSTSGEDANFVLTLTGAAAEFDDNPATATQIGVYYIMIPQEWAGEIVVNADCLFWGEKVNYPSLTTTVPTTWQPGYSYTYTFNISPDDLKVNVEKFTEQW